MNIVSTKFEHSYSVCGLMGKIKKEEQILELNQIRSLLKML